MAILDAVEASLRDFRPKTHRQFVVFSIATRFNDLSNLARYLNASEGHPKRVLLEAARVAERRAQDGGAHAPDVFFGLLADWRREEGL
jgi:hypothetical protein